MTALAIFLTFPLRYWRRVLFAGGWGALEFLPETQIHRIGGASTHPRRYRRRCVQTTELKLRLTNRLRSHLSA